MHFFIKNNIMHHLKMKTSIEFEMMDYTILGTWHQAPQNCSSYDDPLR